MLILYDLYTEKAYTFPECWLTLSTPSQKMVFLDIIKAMLDPCLSLIYLSLSYPLLTQFPSLLLNFLLPLEVSFLSLSS